MARIKVKSIADATEYLLDLLKVDYDTLNNEGCCGSVLLRTGQTDAARATANLTAEKIISKGYTEVVTSCPGCYRTMSSEYPQLVVGGIPFRVRHISQFLFENADELKRHLRPITNVNSVAYHDPCHLGRHMSVFDEPRSLIRMVPGLELKEFKYNREKALCCGSGGGVRSVFPEISNEVSVTLLEELPSDVDLLVTSCPFCKYNFKAARRGSIDAGGANQNKGQSREKTIEVIDLPELLAMSCRGA